MNIELQKLELIQLILTLRDNQALAEIKKFLNGSLLAAKIAPSNGKKKRQYGFAKGMTLYIAPDFDETPAGFEEYMQPQMAV